MQSRICRLVPCFSLTHRDRHSSFDSVNSIVATQAALCTDLSPMARDFWEIPPFVCRDVLLFNMVDECQKSLEPIFFTVHTFVKTDFKGNCAKKSTLWLLIYCKKLSLNSQDKQSMEKIR